MTNTNNTKDFVGKEATCGNLAANRLRVFFIQGFLRRIDGLESIAPRFMKQ